MSCAAIILGAHLASAHPGQARGHAGQPLRSATPGLYAQGDCGPAGGPVGGLYRNSLGRASAYAGWTWSTGAGTQAPVRWSLTVGAVTGYPAAPVLPMVLPSMRIATGPRTALRLVLLPNIRPSVGGAHLAFELGGWQ